MISSITRANVRHLYADIFWYGVLSGSTMAFMTIYAARLGAGALQIGWLTAGPAIVNLAVSLPAGRWLEGRPLRRATYVTALLQRLGYVGMIFLPMIWAASGSAQVDALIGLTLAMAFPAAVLSISFNALFAGVVPADDRADVVGKRNALLALTLTGSSLISGWMLNSVEFPRNYQLVFVLGALGAILSTYHLFRLRPLSEAPDSIGSTNAAMRPALPGLREEVRRLADRLASPAALRLTRPSLGLLQGSFGRFILSYLLFYTFQYLCLPVFPLAFVNDLHLSDWMISLGNALFYISMLAMSLRLGKMSRRWGNHRLLAYSAIAFSIYPITIGLAQGPFWGPFLYWLGSFLGGVIYAVISASLINRLMERVPDEQRAPGMAFHNLALNVGILLGSIAGPLLAEWMGVQPSLLLGAGLRIAAGLLMLRWG